jgi:hypothetical protein
MTYATDEVTIRETDDPTVRDYTPAIDSEPTVEDPTFWPSWSGSPTRPEPSN